MAPHATIKIERPTSDQHRGSFWGSAVEVAAGQHTVTHVPFEHWDFLNIVGPGGGTVRTLDGKVELEVPEGALTEPVVIEIEPLVEPLRAPYAGLLADSVYEFGPDGLQFQVPASVTIEYEGGSVPNGIAESSLVILSTEKEFENIHPLAPWTESTGSSVDGRVTALINHFSLVGVGIPVVEIEFAPPTLGLIPGTSTLVTAEQYAEDGARLVHEMEWSIDDPNVGFISPTIGGLDQALLTGDAIGSTTVRVVVSNEDADADNVEASAPFEVGLGTLTMATATSSRTRSDLNDAVTIGLARSTNIDIGPVDFGDGSVTLNAFTYLGQQLVVFDLAGYGLGPNDLGGVNTLGHANGAGSFGWPIFDAGAPIFYSEMYVPPGTSKSMSFDHPIGHVVRYVRGTCAQMVPWEEIFQQVFIGAATAVECEVPGIVSTDMGTFEAQPHFRSQLGLAPLDEAPVEMGFSFYNQWTGSFGPFVGQVNFNPAYLFEPTEDGYVRVELINNQANVVSGDEDLKASVQQALRVDFIEIFEEAFNSRLLFELEEPFANSCATDSDCLNATLADLEQACELGLTPVACIAETALVADNFECLDNGMCGFHPIVQQLNVLPDGIETVFAPDPHRPAAQLDQLYRALGVQLGEQEVCGAEFSQATSTNETLYFFQRAEKPSESELQDCP